MFRLEPATKETGFMCIYCVKTVNDPPVPVAHGHELSGLGTWMKTKPPPQAEWIER